MREHLDETDAGRFSRRDMSAKELLEVDQHLRDCVLCRTRLAAVVGWNGGVVDTFGALGSLAGPGQPQKHLGYDQLARYADDTLNGRDRSVVERHVSECPTCRTELHELEQFTKDLAGSARARGWRVPFLPAAARTLRQIRRLLTLTGTPAKESPDVTPGRSGPLADDDPTSRVEHLDDVFATCASRLRHWVRRQGPLPEWINADDLVEDTLIVAKGRFESLEDTPAAVIEAYMREAVRRLWRRPMLSPRTPPDPQAFFRQPRFETALNRLEPDDRILILAHLEAKLNFEEMADALGYPNADAAQAACTRALRRLGSQMTESLDPSPLESATEGDDLSARTARKHPNDPFYERE